MAIDALIAEYVAARTAESELRDAPNHVYNLAEYYAACDVTSRIVFRMINHPDWTIDLENKHYPRSAGEIAYPVSC